MLTVSLLAAAIFGVLAALLPDPQVKRIMLILCILCGVVFAILLVMGALAGTISFNLPGVP